MKIIPSIIIALCFFFTFVNGSLLESVGFNPGVHEYGENSFFVTSSGDISWDQPICSFYQGKCGQTAVANVLTHKFNALISPGFVDTYAYDITPGTRPGTLARVLNQISEDVSSHYSALGNWEIKISTRESTTIGPRNRRQIRFEDVNSFGERHIQELYDDLKNSGQQVISLVGMSPFSLHWITVTRVEIPSDGNWRDATILYKHWGLPDSTISGEEYHKLSTSGPNVFPPTRIVYNPGENDDIFRLDQNFVANLEKENIISPKLFTVEVDFQSNHKVIEERSTFSDGITTYIFDSNDNLVLEYIQGDDENDLSFSEILNCHNCISECMDDKPSESGDIEQLEIFNNCIAMCRPLCPYLG